MQPIRLCPLGRGVRRAAALLLLGGCGGADVPDTMTLDGPGFTLEVARAPFAFTVTTTDGTRLEARGLGYAEGTFFITTVLSPGYFNAGGNLTWHKEWVATAFRREANELRVELAPPDADQAAVSVLFSANSGSLSVLARRIGSPAPRAWDVRFASPAGEGFLGMGERFTRTNFRGLALYSFAEEGGIGEGEDTPAGPGNPAPNGEAMTYYPVPFFLSTRGYGFHFDTTWWNEIDFAAAAPDAWRAWHIGPTLAFELYFPAPVEFDERPWPYQIIDRFTARVGRPMLPPAWTLGPRRRINHGDMQGDVSEIQAMRDLDLAITAMDDAFHFLPRGGWIGREAELAANVAAAHALGYKVNAYFNPFFSVNPADAIYPFTQTGIENGYFLLRPGGAPAEGWILTGGGIVTFHMVDFTAPAAVTWYQEQLLARGIAAGYDGWMYDFAEYVPPDALAANGMTGEELHNLYPVLYQQAAHDYLETVRPGEWLTFVRSGYTGASQHSPLVWGGDPAASFEDADGLPSMVRAGINIGIAGVPTWGGDIGGFHCIADGATAADGELLTRWIQVGAFEPNMQDQDACVGGGAGKASIFSSAEAQAAWRKYARLHTRLFPYLYALAHDAHETGAPLIRHVFLEHPDRPELASVDDAYYLGPALYVAPVVERGAREKTAVLPAGRYLDWDTRAVLAAGTVTLEAPLDKLPLLLRENHLVPLLDPRIDTLAPETHPDIVGPDDVAGVYDVVGFVSGEATFAPLDGVLRVVRGAFAAPSLPEAATEEELATCAGCWRRDAAAPGFYRLRVSATGDVTAGQVELSSTTPRRIRWDVVLAE